MMKMAAHVKVSQSGNREPRERERESLREPRERERERESVRREMTDDDG